MNQASSLHPIAAGAPRYPAQRGAAWVVTAEGGGQLAGATTPVVLLLTSSGLCPSEVQHITDMARIYGLFIGSYSLRSNFGGR